jgi:anti-sigma factor RsiW
MFAHLSEYLDRELDASDCRRIEHHLACCDACRACFETLAQTVALCREMPARTVPEDMATRLRAAIAQLNAASRPPQG